MEDTSKEAGRGEEKEPVRAWRVCYGRTGVYTVDNPPGYIQVRKRHGSSNEGLKRAKEEYEAAMKEDFEQATGGKVAKVGSHDVTVDGVPDPPRNVSTRYGDKFEFLWEQRVEKPDE